MVSTKFILSFNSWGLASRVCKLQFLSKSCLFKIQEKGPTKKFPIYYSFIDPTLLWSGECKK